MLHCANGISVAALGNSPVIYELMEEKTAQNPPAVPVFVPPFLQ